MCISWFYQVFHHWWGTTWIGLQTVTEKEIKPAVVFVEDSIDLEWAQFLLFSQGLKLILNWELVSGVQQRRIPAPRGRDPSLICDSLFFLSWCNNDISIFKRHLLLERLFKHLFDFFQNPLFDLQGRFFSLLVDFMDLLLRIFRQGLNILDNTLVHLLVSLLWIFQAAYLS